MTNGTSAGQIKLDRIDLQILAIIQQDARLTNVMLAERVGLSASPCLERVRRLEKGKLISAYRAVLNLEKLIPHLYTYMEVTLQSHHLQDFMRFEKYVLKQPEILTCSLISGDFDYLIRVIATDIAHLHSISERMFNAEVGVEKHFTYICVKTVKDTTEVPIDALLAARQKTVL